MEAMKDKKTESDSKPNDSYFAASRRKNRKTVIKVIIPVVAVAIVLGIVFAAQAGQQGVGAKMVMHLHPKLTITVNGDPITIPENIGIDSALYKDHSLDKYGMEGMAPLHTHDSAGTIHVESSAQRDYTLGEFSDTWGGLDVNGKQVYAVVDGKPVSDYRNIVLKDGAQINLEVK
jgi:hypothetical protein